MKKTTTLNANTITFDTSASSEFREDDLPLQEAPDIASSTDDYASRFAGPVGIHMLQVQWDLVRRCLPPPTAGCRILDLGGGHAQLAVPLVAAGYDVTVLGSDPTCRHRLEQRLRPDQYQFQEGNLLELPWEPLSFDVVLGFRMLAHLRHWKRFVAEACRVSRSSVIFDYPEFCSVNWLSESLFRWKKRIEKNTRPYQCFYQKDLLRELNDCGFCHEFSEGQFVFPMALHRAVGSSLFCQLTESMARGVGLQRWIGSPVVLHAVRK